MILRSAPKGTIEPPRREVRQDPAEHRITDPDSFKTRMPSAPCDGSREDLRSSFAASATSRFHCASTPDHQSWSQRSEGFSEVRVVRRRSSLRTSKPASRSPRKMLEMSPTSICVICRFSVRLSGHHGHRTPGCSGSRVAAAIAIRLVLRLPAPLKCLADQVIRSASSVPANLSEGHGRSGRDRNHHWRIAYASAKEVDTHLRLLTGAGAIDRRRAESALELFDDVRAMTWRLLHPRAS